MNEAISTSTSTQHIEYSRTIVPSSMRSPYWKYFGFPSDKDNNILTRMKIICTLCNTAIAYNKNTSNLRTHLLAMHANVLMELTQEKAADAAVCSAVANTPSKRKLKVACDMEMEAKSNQIKDINGAKKYMKTNLSTKLAGNAVMSDFIEETNAEAVDYLEDFIVEQDSNDFLSDEKDTTSRTQHTMKYVDVLPTSCRMAVSSSEENFKHSPSTESSTSANDLVLNILTAELLSMEHLNNNSKFAEQLLNKENFEQALVGFEYLLL